MTTLRLKQEPTFEWDGESGCVMCVNNTLKISGYFFSQKIVECITDYVIHVNLNAISNTIRFYKQGAFYMNPQITKIVVSQLLYHECRHIWQAQSGFYVGKEYNPFVTSINKGHGEEPAEVDANTFAVSMAKNKKERVIAELQKKSQEVSGKVFGVDIKKEQLAFIKEFNPLLKWFVAE
jgi:hypothetical protein